MSAVGSDAAFMLEKALEEMDDMFRDTETEITPSSPRMRHTSKPVQELSMSKLLKELEDCLNEQNYTPGVEKQCEEHIYREICTLPKVKGFFEDFNKFLHGQSDASLYAELDTVKKEKDAFLLQVGSLSDQIEKTEQELHNLQYQLEAEKLKNSENRADKPDSDLKFSTDERSNEMDKFKSRVKSLPEGQGQGKSQAVEDESTSALKARLREKASEVNRLRLIVEDLKASHEAKDNAMDTMKMEMDRLHMELKQIADDGRRTQSCDNHRANGSVQNGEINNDVGYTKGSFTDGGHRCNSEPSLVRNELKTAIVKPQLQVPASNRSFGHDYKRELSGQSFSNWTSEQLQEWLEDEGLSMYTAAFSKALTRGDDLFKYTATDMDRLLGLSLGLHQKKLMLALQALKSPDPDYKGRLDYNWVARWLDDIGLPQYKNSFYESRVDGRILHNLTMDDLINLKVYNTLHHISLKRAIQGLRHQNFHPNYLKSIEMQSDDRCSHVMLWTNAKIIEWLRSIDLAEYAPNLRGSGVHGALMILEPRFNADSLANLLSIPNNKSLLRRHIATQFGTLINETCQRQKEMTEQSTDYIPLNPSEKRKHRKRGLSFGALRRRKSETELDQHVCPMNLDVPPILSPPPALDPEEDVFEFADSISPAMSNEQDSSLENGSNLREFSQDISTLTTMLNHTR